MGWEDRDYNREDEGGSSLRLPKSTSLAIALIAICTIVYMVVRIFPGGVNLALLGGFTYNDGLWYAQPWRWITFQYVHGSFGQLAWSMIGVYFMVPVLEQFWGWRRTLILFTLSGFGAAIALKVLQPFIGSDHLLFGSMGGVLGVLAAVAVLAPRMNIMFMMIAPMSMRNAAILYAVIYSLIVLTDRNGTDAADLGGLVVGALIPWVMNGGVARHPILKKQVRRWQDMRAQRAYEAEANEQQEIDRILAKVGEKGMNSLTGSERKALARASENQRKRDAARRR